MSGASRQSASLPTRLPRLVYVADVPVRRSFGGMALLYRLFQEYPASLLRIVESSMFSPPDGGKLPGVSYLPLRLGPRRPLRTRFSEPYSRCLYAVAPAHAAHLRWRLTPFDPEAVVTVAHGWTWRTAARLASALGVPLHLIVHDDCASMVGPSRALRARADEDFGRVYRGALSRLCVSPRMAEVYEDRYGAPATVLYPLRAPDLPMFTEPAAGPRGPFTVAYAGSINGTHYLEPLLTLARVLERLEGRLDVYTSRESGEALARTDLPPTVALHSMLAPSALVSTLRRTAHVLILPASFHPDDRTNVETSFPSKLTDYTATGLPLLVWGPPYAAAVRWAAENLGAARALDTDDGERLQAMLADLRDRPAHRAELARAALAVGERYFSYQSIVQQWWDALAGSRRAIGA